MSDNIGNKFDDFIILKILKKSKVKVLDEEYLYGYVAKVKSKIDGKIYAMKRIDKSKLLNKAKKDYYDKEYEMANFIKGQLKHNNLYNPVKVFKEKNIIYIISEYIDGNNLSDLYNKVDIKISEKRLVKIFDQCLNGLKFIHKKGIIHRFININNIMIDSEDRVKMINFSYAIKKEKVKDNNDEMENQNKIFKAPELVKGQNAYNDLIDVYALGSVFNFFKPHASDKIFFEDFYKNIIIQMKKEVKRPSAEEIHKTFKNIINLLYF